MSDIDPNKMKVAELREELKTRGLDTKGTKAVLVKRLQQAFNKEQGIAGKFHFLLFKLFILICISNLNFY